MCYANYQILGQIIEPLNLPEDIRDCLFQEKEVKLVRPRYEPLTRGDEEENFLNYRFDENKSKLLYSFCKRRIPKW